MFVKHRKTARLLLALSIIWILNCCAYQQPPSQPAPVEVSPESPVLEPVTPVEPKTEAETPEPRFYLYKVRWPEETLSHIAKWYTGSLKNWKVIAEANPGLDPKKIKIGDTISIPEELLTSRQPMPHSFVQPAVHKKNAPIASSKKTSTQPESPKLFGPLESKPSTVEKDSSKLFGPVETRQPSLEPDGTKMFGPIE